MTRSMKKILCAALVAANCALLNAADVSIIPQPQSVKMLSGEFEVMAKTKITFAGGETEAKLLAATLRHSTGFKLPVKSVSTLPAASEITFLLKTNESEKFGNEGAGILVVHGRLSINVCDLMIVFSSGKV